MTFQELKERLPGYEECLVIGRTCRENGRLCHIAGMGRRGTEGTLYVLTFPPETAGKEAEEGENGTNRSLMKHVREYGCFDGVGALCAGGVWMDVEGMETGSLAINDYTEPLVFFADLFKNGWEPPEEGAFAGADWEDLLLTKIRLSLEEGRMPDWSGDISLRYHKSGRQFFVEQPLTLRVGEEVSVPFSLPDGRSGVCHVNNTYPVDIWREQEERFRDPRYLLHMTEEELAETKRTFFEALEKGCPRGMCYLGIEYECSIDGNLVFYDRKFLDGEPAAQEGSALLLMMMLKPDQPTGAHSLKLRGCAVQTPVSPDIKEFQAELFTFVEPVPEREERLLGPEEPAEPADRGEEWRRESH